MMFSFQLVVEGEVVFYELGRIRELDETLIFELNHFGKDLKGWEEKEELQSFQFIKTDGNRVCFEGQTFEKVSEDQINIYGIIHQYGKDAEVKFNYLKQ